MLKVDELTVSWDEKFEDAEEVLELLRCYVLEESEADAIELCSDGLDNMSSVIQTVLWKNYGARDLAQALTESGYAYYSATQQGVYLVDVFKDWETARKCADGDLYNIETQEKCV